MSERISEDRLRNTRAWAAARPEMSGNIVIVGAIDELLALRREWIPVTSRLPDNGVKVFAYFQNELGKGRRVLAHYARQWSTEAGCCDDDTPDDWYDVDESGTSFVPEGWYEECYTQESCRQISETITHWHALPSGPK